jgi:hypothetical protein
VSCKYIIVFNTAAAAATAGEQQACSHAGVPGAAPESQQHARQLPQGCTTAAGTTLRLQQQKKATSSSHMYAQTSMFCAVMVATDVLLLLLSFVLVTVHQAALQLLRSCSSDAGTWKQHELLLSFQSPFAAAAAAAAAGRASLMLMREQHSLPRGSS